MKLLPTDNRIDIYSYGADSSKSSDQSDDRTIKLESKLASSSDQPVNYKGNFTGNLICFAVSFLFPNVHLDHIEERKLSF